MPASGSRGHKFKVGYEIDKNFGVGATYLMAKTDYSNLPNTMRTWIPCSWTWKPSSKHAIAGNADPIRRFPLFTCE